MNDAALLQASERAYFSGNVNAAAELWLMASRRHRQSRNNSNALVAALYSAMCQLVVGRSEDPLLRMEAAAMTERLGRSEPSSPRCLTFRAELKIVEMMSSLSVVASRQLCDDAIALLDAALADSPGCVHALLVAGLFHYHLPETFGGSKKRAFAMLELAAQHPEHGKAMRALLMKKFPPGGV